MDDATYLTLAAHVLSCIEPNLENWGAFLHIDLNVSLEDFTHPDIHPAIQSARDRGLAIVWVVAISPTSRLIMPRDDTTGDLHYKYWTLHGYSSYIGFPTEELDDCL